MNTESSLPLLYKGEVNQYFGDESSDLPQEVLSQLYKSGKMLTIQ